MSEPITFKIIRVKDTSFSVTETAWNPTIPVEKKQVRISCEIRYNLDSEILMLEMMPSFLYMKDDESEDIYATMIVHNAFEVKDLKRFMDGEILYLPPHFLVTIVGMCISHSRALFLKALEGTPFTGTIMPVIDPVAFCKQAFKYMFDYDESKNKEPN